MQSITNDFSDKLNPVLVKELRQGLRGISFVTLFIAVQAFLCFILLITTAVASPENAGHLLSRVIFFFFSLAVLVVQPLRGISALSAEIKANTIDLLCLTRLSAWRITFGKWISLVSQSALILTAIIPYLIMRYFFGDMQMFAEILLLLSTFLLSATFTAITVGFSGVKSVIVRVLLPICASFWVFAFIWNIYLGGRYNFQKVLQMVTLTDASSVFAYAGFLTACVYFAWICLDLGTSIIAPIAENRSTPRRVISMTLIILTMLALSFAGTSTFTALVIGLALCVPVSIISLTENPQLVTPITTPFTRRGLLGKAAGRLLYPGWATGLIFVILLYLIMHAFLMFYAYRGIHVEKGHIIVLNSIFAIIIFPLALTRLFARNHGNRLGLFLLFLCTEFLAVLTIYACENYSRDLDIMRFFFWLPSSFLYLDDFSKSTLVNASYFNVALYFLIAFATALPVWKHIREVENLQPQSSN